MLMVGGGTDTEMGTGTIRAPLESSSLSIAGLEVCEVSVLWAICTVPIAVSQLRMGCAE